jgi:hypothetical protein
MERLRSVVSRRLAILVLAFLAGLPGPAAAQAKPAKVIHAVVALCDNQYQGIVPVPARIGNGDDPANNLYWGAAYGVKSFFLKAKGWSLVAKTANPRPAVLERYVFKYGAAPVYLVADAYRGREIWRATNDFFQFAAGRSAETIALPAIKLQAGGGADLVAYVGHDGLMDFRIAEGPRGAPGRGAIILACASKPYFAAPLRNTGADPLLWTTGLMAPEAYVLKAAVEAWIAGEGGEGMRRRAAAAYDQYQKCGSKAALRLFATGW